MTLLNLDAQFASHIDHPKTLDRLALDLEGAPKYVARKRGAARYVPADECSVLMSDAAEKIAVWMLGRDNWARHEGREPYFLTKYHKVCGLARRKYPLPTNTMPHWIADEDRLANLAPIPNHRYSER